MKPKQEKNNHQTGFTLIELLTVMTIMALLMGALLIDFQGQKTNRNLVIAKNETVTNLRKVQSYMLSSKNISTNLPAKFYIAEFHKGDSFYTIQAVDNSYGFHDNLEKINLPTGVSFVNLTADLHPNSYDCAQIIFSAPFGSMYAFGGSTSAGEYCGTSIVATLKDPVKLAALSQRNTYLSFRGVPSDSTAKYIKISPLTGQISAN